MLVDIAPSTSNAAIIAADISAGNGVVHVIDNVVVPPDICLGIRRSTDVGTGSGRSPLSFTGPRPGAGWSRSCER